MNGWFATQSLHADTFHKRLWDNNWSFVYIIFVLIQSIVQFVHRSGNATAAELLGHMQNWDVM